jgi:hypothetical protein
MWLLGYPHLKLVVLSVVTVELTKSFKLYNGRCTISPGMLALAPGAGDSTKTTILRAGNVRALAHQR